MARDVSYVLSRTLFVDDRNGRVRFSDFTLTNTAVGTCVECRQAGRIGFDAPMRQVDNDSVLYRIDRLESFDWRDPSAVLGRLHDINCFPTKQTYSVD